MKLVVDMNMSIKWVDALMEAGFEAHHWRDVGDRSSPDAQIMTYAIEIGAVVLTRDMDFSAILATNQLSKPSVVHLSERDRFAPLTVQRRIVALTRFKDDLENGAILSIAAGRVRLRRLPVTGAER